MSSEPVPIADSSEEKAFRTANTAVLHHLTRRIQDDPAADLADMLSQHAANYVKLVQGLKQPSSGNDYGGDNSGRASTHGALVTKTVFLSGASTTVVRPLRQDLLNLLDWSEEKGFSNSASAEVPRVLVNALDKIMSEGEVLHELCGARVTCVGPQLVVKSGRSLDLDHVSNLDFVHQRLDDFPAPICVGVLANGSRILLFLTRGLGNTLETLWPSLSVDNKLRVKDQLQHHFERLRQIKREEDSHLGSPISKKCKDMRRIYRESNHILNEADFNDFLCTYHGHTASPWIQMIRSCMKDEHEIVMSHGNLHPRNIMATFEPSKEGSPHDRRIKITSILDWEAAGWYPEYWDFVKAINTVGPRDRALRDWIEYLPFSAIGAHPVEYAIDCLITRWLG